MPDPVTAITAGATVIGGAMSSSASRSAANAQQRAADAATAEQARQYDQTRQDQMPWMDAGRNALARLQDPNAFTASPGYGFRLQQGQQAVNANAGARGGLFSGNALRALTDYNQNSASAEYGNWWNQQSGLAGLGQNSANAVGAAGANAANNTSNILIGAGDARASGIQGQSNALTGTLTGLSALVPGAYNNYLNSRLQPYTPIFGAKH